jgi:outer membrane protein
MNTLLRSFTLAVLSAIVLSAGYANAQDKKAVSVAVLDLQQLLKTSKGAQNIESQLVTIRKEFQSVVEKEEKTLREAEKAIVDQKGKLSEADFKKKAQEFQTKVAASQKKIQERKNKLDKALGVAVGKLRDQIVKVASDISTKKGFDVVVARSSVVIVPNKDLDITQQVLERVDADLPEIKVSVE